MWRKKRKNPKISRVRQKIYNICLGAVLGMSVIAYLIQANGLATKGYKIKDLEKVVTDLTRVQRELEGKSLELQSMSAISRKLENIQMVEAKEAIYLYPNSKTVLKK